MTLTFFNTGDKPASTVWNENYRHVGRFGFSTFYGMDSSGNYAAQPLGSAAQPWLSANIGTISIASDTITAVGTNADIVLAPTGSGALVNKQVCKAWVNFNGIGTVAIRDSFNVSSVTDINVGRYGVNFTNNMTDANYSIVSASSGAHGHTIGDANWAVSNASEAVSTSEAYVGSQDNSSDTYWDCTNVNVVVFSN